MRRRWRLPGRLALLLLGSVGARRVSWDNVAEAAPRDEVLPRAAFIGMDLDVPRFARPLLFKVKLLGDARGRAASRALADRVPDDVAEGMIKVEGAMEEFCGARSDDGRRLSAAARLFEVIPGLLRADIDEHGDPLPGRRGFWNEVAFRLVEILRRGRPDDLLETNSAEIESEEVRAAAMVLLVLIADAVSEDLFDDAEAWIIGWLTLSDTIHKSVRDLCRGCPDVEPIGEFLFRNGEITHLGGRDPGMSKAARQWRRKYCLHSGIPWRWREGLLWNILLEFTSAKSGALAVESGTFFLDSLPSFTWRNETMWDACISLLQEPIAVKGPRRREAADLQDVLREAVLRHISEGLEELGIDHGLAWPDAELN